MGRFKVALVALDGQTVPDWVPLELGRSGIDLVIHECQTREELGAGDADVVWVFGGSRIITAEGLRVIPRCGAIIRTGSGTDNVPVEEATGMGIVVANTPEAHSDAVSDHAIGLLFSIIRRIPVQDRAVRAGTWNREIAWPRWHVRGQTLGLVGFGHVARLLVRKLAGFEMRVLAYDPYVGESAMKGEGVEGAGLDRVLTESDFLSLHCPLTRQTHHIIGSREMRMMKASAVLVNTSRGALVDESALVQALTEGWIAAAGLDVLEQEPGAPTNPLFRLDNVVITPHIAGYSDEHLDAGWRLSAETAIALAQGRWPRSYVNHNVRPRWDLA